jgi:O-antigen/teichoic acid export membrane protein
VSEARGLGRETLWYAAANVASGALGLVSLSLFSGWVGKTEFGAYALILAWASILTAVACAWINQTIKRYYTSFDGPLRAQFMGRILAAYIVTGAVLLGVTLVASAVLPLFGRSAWTPWPILGLTLGTAAPQYVQWLFAIRRQAADYAVNQTLYNAARLGLGWLMLHRIAATGEVLAWSVALAGLLAALEGLLRLREPYSLQRHSFSRLELQPLWAYGWPLTLVNGGGWLINTAGRVVLEPLAGPAAVGVYSVGQQLAQQVVQLAVNPIITAADPLAIRVHNRDGAAAAARFLSHLLGLLILLGSGVCLVLTLLAQPLTAALYDPQYAAAGGLYGYFAPAMLLWLLSPVLLKSQEIGEKLGELPWLMLGAGALNIGLNFTLIPRLGTLGAALAMLAANAALSAACYWRGRQHLHWPLPWKLLAVAALSLAVTAGLIQLLPAPRGVLQCALAFAGYMVAYLGCAAGALLAARRIFHDELAFVGQIASRRA